MSKGSWRRPTQIDEKTFQNNWDAIFNKNRQHQANPQGADSETRKAKQVQQADNSQKL